MGVLVAVAVGVWVDVDDSVGVDVNVGVVVCVRVAVGVPVWVNASVGVRVDVAVGVGPKTILCRGLSTARLKPARSPTRIMTVAPTARGPAFSEIGNRGPAAGAALGSGTTTECSALQRPGSSSRHARTRTR